MKFKIQNSKFKIQNSKKCVQSSLDVINQFSYNFES